MAELNTEIKVGDSVRARGGIYKGEVGTALRVVKTRDKELNSDKVLVSFAAGGADYLNAHELEKAEQGEV